MQAKIGLFGYWESLISTYDVLKLQNTKVLTQDTQGLISTYDVLKSIAYKNEVKNNNV